MGIATGLVGVTFDEAAAGLARSAMGEAVGLDGMAIVLAGVWGQNRGITADSTN